MKLYKQSKENRAPKISNKITVKIYSYFSFVFSIVTKKVELLKILKVIQPF